MKRAISPRSRCPFSNLLLFLLATVLSISLSSDKERENFNSSGQLGVRSVKQDSSRSLGFYFEENLGQEQEEVRFLARSEGYRVLLEEGQSRIQLQGGAEIRMQLISRNRDAAPVGSHPLPGPVHYLLGNDPSRWVRDVPRYGKVSIQEIYPGIDLVFYSRDQLLEYDFLVRAGADPSLIEMSFEGTEKIELDNRGNLYLRTGAEEMQLMAPYVYQEIGGQKRALAVDFEIRESGSVGFKVEAHDPDHTLVIDPILVYSSLLGGGRRDVARSLVIDAAGNAYVGGSSEPVGFPTENLLGGSMELDNGFIAKFSPQGELIFTTFVGGTLNDYLFGIDLGPDESIFVTGYTNSLDFPIKNAFQADHAGASDAFLTKISADGTEVLFSTFLGGTFRDDLVPTLRFDYEGDITVDSQGNAYIAGTTRSADFPTRNAFQPSKTDPGIFNFDAFVAKFDTTGDLLYSSYLGGSDTDLIRDIEIDADGALYVVGGTQSADFPRVRANRSVLEGDSRNLSFRRETSEAFLAKISPSGTSLEYSSFIGGSGGDDGAGGLVVEAPDIVYVLGHTDSEDFPIDLPGPASASGDPPSLYRLDRAGKSDLFLVKINTAQARVDMSVLIGGSREEASGRLAKDDHGRLILTGGSRSFDFPLWDPIQGTLTGEQDAVVSAFLPDTGQVLFSIYLGGGGNDWGQAVAAQGDAVFLAGFAAPGRFGRARDFPVARNRGLPGRVLSQEAFVAKLETVSPRLLAPGAEWTGFIRIDTNQNGYPDPRDEVVTIDADLANEALFLSTTRWSSNDILLTNLGGDSVYGGIRFEKPDRDWVVDATVTEMNNGRIQTILIKRTKPDNVEQGQVELIDRDENGVVDAVAITIEGQPTALISLERADIDGDGVADFVTIPWALKEWFFVDGKDTTPDPQVFIPIADTDLDGIPDTIGPDLDGDGLLDSQLPLVPPLSGPSITPDHSLHFAHFGDGEEALFSEILLYSLGTATANVHVDIRDDEGNPLSVDLNGEMVHGETDLQIPVCGLRSLRTDGVGPLVTGSVSVTSDQPIGGVILFGGVVGLAGVGSSPEMVGGFYAPIEANLEEQTSTGIAIKNLEGETATISFTLLTSDGAVAAETTRVVAGLGHLALFASQLFPALDLSEFLGTLVVTAEGRLTATVLQTRPQEFATLPVTHIRGGDGRVLFAHFGEGEGQLFSQFLVLNLNQEAIDFDITVFGADGQRQAYDLNGMEFEPGFRDPPFNLGARGTFSGRTDGEGELVSGWVNLFTAPARRISAVILFGGAVGVAGVPGSELMTAGFLAPIQTDLQSALNTGVALANGERESLKLRFQLFDRNGTLLATTMPLELAARAHKALFIDEFSWLPEPGIALDFDDFSGLLKATSDGPIAAVVLQTRPGQFATMPVSPYSR